MGLFNKVFDHFKTSDFTVAPNKKVKSVKKEFKDSFNLSLRIYKGSVFAEDSLTLKQLNEKTKATTINTNGKEFTLRASMKVGDAEEMFKTAFGIKVQIADKDDKKLINNKLTLGDAARA